MYKVILLWKNHHGNLQGEKGVYASQQQDSANNNNNTTVKPHMAFHRYHVMLPTYSSLLVKNGRSHESGLHLIDVIFWPMRKQHINERSYILAYILRRIVILQAYHRQCRAEGPQVGVFVKPSITLTTPANLSRLLKKLSENIYQNKIQGLFLF